MSFSASVIVPSHNRAALVAETLDHILAQTEAPHEIIVADDGSTDDTAAVLRRYGPAVTVLKLPRSGAPAARHAAVQASSGRYLAFCDSDDLWAPDHLARMRALFAASNRLDYAFANFRSFSAAGPAAATKFDSAPQGFWSGVTRSPTPDSWIIEGGFTENLVRFQPIFPSTVVLSRAHYDRVGGFDRAMSHVPSEDLEFTLRCVRDGPIGVLATPTVHIRKHEGNTSRSQARQVIGEICILNHVLNHHPVPARTRLLITGDLERRCRDALDLAFTCGDMDLVRLLNAAVQRTSLSARQKIKVQIAISPTPIKTILTQIATREEFRKLKAGINTYLRTHLYLAVRDIIARRAAMA